MKQIGKIALIILGIILVMAFIYGMYELTKSLSYSWWYEEMVRDTVKEMVKPEFLK